MTSAYSINLNFNNTIPVKTDFTFKQGDKGITLNLATIGLDTTGTTAHIVFKRSNGTSVEAELTGQTGPSYSYTILGNEFEIPGVVVADLKLYNGDTQRVSTASFIFMVTGDTMDGVGGGTGGYSDQLEELSQEFSNTLEEYKDAFGDVGAVNPRGAYDSTADYNVLDLVSYQGSSYLCRTACKNKLPTNTTYWQVFASGGGGGTSDYDDLTDKPSINSVTLSGNKTTEDLGLFSGDYDDLTNKPALFSGNYNDLTNKPTIPSDFGDLADVDMTGVTDGQIPAWDATSQKFKPVTPASPSGIVIPSAVAFNQRVDRNWDGLGTLVANAKDVTADFDGGTLSTKIAANNFDDYDCGMQIVKTITINNTNYTAHIIFAHANAFYGYSNAAMVNTPNIGCLVFIENYLSAWNSSTTAGGYATSLLRTNIQAAVTALENTLGSSHLLAHDVMLSNAVTDGKASGWTWYTNSKGEALSSAQCVGSNNSLGSYFDIGEAFEQLALLKMIRINQVIGDYYMWVRDVFDDTRAAIVRNQGSFNRSLVNDAAILAVPFILLK